MAGYLKCCDVVARQHLWAPEKPIRLAQAVRPRSSRMPDERRGPAATADYNSSQ